MISEKMKTLVAGNSIIRVMFEEGKRLASLYGAENVLDFSLGNPSAPPPEAVKDALLEILNSGKDSEIHAYMNNAGYEDMRGIVANHINKLQGTKFAARNIIMTVGAAGGLNVVLKAIINPGDEIIMFSPFFSEYVNYIANADGKAVIVQSDIKTFQPDLAAFEQAITKNTKAVIINSPNNPTGAVYSEETIKAMSSILESKQKEYSSQIYIISDEPYREIVYNNTFIPYVTKYYNNSFVVYSYSKSLSLPGERIGYIVAPDELFEFETLIQALTIANRILGFVNAPSLFQRVVGKCIDVNVDMTVYTKNMELLYDTFNRLGFECLKPQGTFYIFPRAINNDGAAFCKKAAEDHNILLVPGKAFGCPTHFRIAFCQEHEKIQRSVEKFEALAKQFK
ncbi:MAG: pyridoxal phosphate-dependent aminotransferase [Defluviitaleaceae bacterium]|nr:pyridoxal phosphate-dependent aminotransferase [Defluviitaleaceae bacterium]